MAAVNDGGPAFPSAGEMVDYKARTVSQIGHTGMSLRDYFAGQALAGSVATYRSGEFEDNPRELAEVCYMYAEYMVEQKRRMEGEE